METWRTEMTEALRLAGESWQDVIACTLTDVELDALWDYEWDESFGFTMWTNERVYFPVIYDGAESVSSALGIRPTKRQSISGHVRGLSVADADGLARDSQAVLDEWAVD